MVWRFIGKAILSFFGTLVESSKQYLVKGHTTINAYYYILLNQLLDAQYKKRCGMITKVIRLLEDNVLAQSQIVEVYGEEAISGQHVTKWCPSFQSSIQNVENRNIAGRDQPNSSRHELKKLFQNERRVTEGNLVRSGTELWFLIGFDIQDSAVKSTCLAMLLTNDIHKQSLLELIVC
ncbi:hypothetical protein TNCV_7221 [Trichonephila clavipes]|nr:hypothetical protein TNCV_7221 [Trichonephila clavipes]